MPFESPASAAETPSGAPPSDSLLLARFQAFLDSTVAAHRDSSPEFPGPEERCEADQFVPDVDYLLAVGRALTVVRRSAGDATVRAALTIVGEDSLSPAGARRISVGVRTDTVEWDLVRDTAGVWHPCGYASTNRGLGRMGTRQYPAKWNPPGSGWAAVARLSDSVRRAHALPR